MDIFFEADNQRDITMDDLEDLARFIRAQLPDGTEVNLNLHFAEEQGAGLGWDDLLNVVVPVTEYVGSQAGGAVITLTVEHAIAWMRTRFSKKHEERQIRIVRVYSPDGALLQEYRIDSVEAPARRMLP